MILGSVSRLMLAAVFTVCASALVLAQSNGSISGVVKDSAGGVIPGAAVVVKNNATATTLETASNNEGVFSIPALDAGTYTITVRLAGFKTAVVADVRVAPGTQAAVNAVLEIGALTETVNVQSSSELINTQTATISSTLNVDQINRMPMASRNALNAVTFLPGVNTAGVNRNSTVNGLPESFLNITMDGISNNDNFNKTTDGFFASVTPRQDAIEAVTVTTAVGGADTGGHGAVTINFQTRSGSNRFTGSVYEYFRHKSLNTNYWFNQNSDLPKNDVKLNQYGVRQGGPIIIPGVYNGQGKAFFFVNYEELRLPNDFTRTRSVLHPRAQEGWFRYNVTVGDVQQVREVNVLTLAGNAGHITAKDPMVLKLQGFINAATATTGVLRATSDPMLLDYVWQSPGYQWERQPVIRIDYNITSKHRLSGTYNQLWTERDPDHLNGADVRFPGSPNYRVFWSTRPTRSFTLRSTLTQNLVSEARVGITKGGTSYFGKNQYDYRGVSAFDDQDGYSIDFDSDIGVTNWWATAGPSWRAAYQWTFDETLTWQKGKHGLSFGGSAFLGRTFENAQTLVPSIQLGFDTTNDPARGLFNTTNFSNASGGQLTDARQLYGLLTGRVTSVGGQAVLDPATKTYTAFAPRTRQGNIDVYSLFAQDSWRTTPTLTINAGLRWDLQLPFSPVHDLFSQSYLEDACGMSGLGPNTTIYDKCNFLAPGSSGGKVPEYSLLGAGARGYNIDWNNLAPNVGVAWRPNVQTGFLRTLLGDPEQATLRGGYSISFERQGFGVFTGLYGSNPGATLSLTRSANSAEPLVPAGQSWPVLLQERSRLNPASFPNSPTYPIAIRANRADSLNLFAPDIEIAAARSWTVSFQRSITRNTAVDVRYVGTRGVNQWSQLNYNSIRGENLVAAGFIDEFNRAQQNLAANNAAGGSRLGSIAYFGPGTGTNPLPIYLAFIAGQPASQAGDAALYTSSLWTDTTLAGRHVRVNPSPTGAAGDLEGNTTRRANAITGGLPANLFRPNPLVSEVNVTDSGAFSDYHALQVELRRRLSRGLQVNGSYQYALEGGSFFLGFSRGREMGASPNVRHAFKTQWDWTIPVGRDQRYGNNLNPLLNAILGGWQMNGVGRVQATTVDLGGVRLVGMTVKEFTKMYKHDIRINPDTGLRTAYMLPDDVILNTRRAFSVSSTTADGYSASLGAPEGRYIAPANSATCVTIYAGDCAPLSLLIRAPWYTRFDIGVTKRFPLRGSTNFELRLDVLNVFDNVNFDLEDSPGTGSTLFQVDGAYRDPSNTFDPGGRLGQLVFRLNW